MNSFLSIIAIILVIFWTIGFFVFSFGVIINALLVVAIILAIVRLFRDDDKRG